MKRLYDAPVETTENVDINLSPLIDMMFLLLIFFMVTAVFVKETGIEVNRPETSSAQKLRDDSLFFAVSTEGDIHHDGALVSLQAVRGIVAANLDQETKGVVILADRLSYTGKIMKVISRCKQAGAKNVSIAARRGKNEGSE